MPERIPVAAIKDRVSWHWSSGVMPWSAKFNQPIKWGARSLQTLNDAREFILGLPKSKQMLPQWQRAVEALLEATEHGGLWLDLARIETMQALLGEQPMSQPKVKKHSC
jgi:hypothetical protein